MYLEYPEPPVSRKEILRYAGVMRPEAAEADQAQMQELLDRAITAALPELTYRVSYVRRKLDWDADGYPVLPFEQHSDNLRRNLTGCSETVIFTATVGAGIDRLIRRYDRTEPSLALMLQALGAERAEALCDAFNDDIKKEAGDAGRKCHARYSPGYGDLPISVQPYVLELTDAYRRLGITLSESLLMSPSKSVTAIIGIE